METVQAAGLWAARTGGGGADKGQMWGAREGQAQVAAGRLPQAAQDSAVRSLLLLLQTKRAKRGTGPPQRLLRAGTEAGAKRSVLCGLQKEDHGVWKSLP